MQISFSGKTALVTGASNGIGRDIAINLAKCGAKVIAIGRSKTDLESLKEETNCETIVLDLSDYDETSKIVENLGPIDLLVNNAGQSLRKSLIDSTKEDLNNIFDVNFKPVFNITQLIIKDLLKRKKPGVIVNVSSLCGLIGVLNHTVYCATKGAMDAFTRAVAMEYGPYGIRINSVNPTVVFTKMGQENAKVQSQDVNNMLEKTPLQRLGQLKDVTDPVLFLLSDMSSLITGISLPIDGGYHIC